MPLIETSCCSVYFADHRRESVFDTPFLLIHGAGGTHLDWSLPLRRLGAIAPDLPGHGKSPAPGFQTIGDYARSMVSLLDALSIPKAVICGHSMGGAIAQTMALDYPERMRGLILMGTGAKLSVHPNILDRVLEHQAEVGLLLKSWLWSEYTDDKMREVSYQQFMKNDPKIVHGDYLACNAFDVRPRLAEIQTPTLVIGGTADKMTPYKFSVSLAENIPNAELVTIKDAGHMVMLEQPEPVGNTIQGWMRRLLSH